MGFVCCMIEQLGAMGSSRPAWYRSTPVSFKKGHPKVAYLFMLQ